MKIGAVIAEYNPFHNGHAYQLRRIRETYGYDAVIAVMSGDFTQRGTPAVIDKFERARMALEAGADLVIELPVWYACASAEYFATGAVSLLDSLGCVDALFFGSEMPEDGHADDNPSPSLPAVFMRSAEILSEEPARYRSVLSRTLKTGCGYAAARLSALCAALEDADEKTPHASSLTEKKDALPVLLSKPNNTLGIEYCRAILRTKSPIRPYAIRRIGSGYHDRTLSCDSTYASAEAIRSFLLSPAARTACDIRRALAPFVPPSALETLILLHEKKRLTSQNDFSLPLHYQLLLQQSRLEDYADCTPDIANRIRRQLFSFCGNDCEAFIRALSTKAYPCARISRVMTHILLGMTARELHALTESLPYPAHARILGLRRSASGTLLSEIRANTRIPLVAKPSAYRPEGIAAALYEADLAASHIYQSAVTARTGEPVIHERRRSPVIV